MISTSLYLLPQSEERLGEEAVWTPDRALTFDELEERSRRVANGLRSGGVGPGVAFGVLARNRVEWPELVFGNIRARSRYVPLNWHLTAGEVAELLVDSGARLLIVGGEEESIGREAAAIAEIDRVIVLGDQYETWLAGQSDAPLEDGPMGTPLLYTGGTTGRSKGVTRSDLGVPVSKFGTLAARFGQNLHMPAEGRGMLCTPAYHALGFGIIQGTLGQGHTLTILPRFDPVETVRTIEERSITVTAMVPTQFVRLLKLGDDERLAHDVTSLEWVLHTAAPCPRWAKEAMIDWFGPVIVELYGSSEGTGPVVCTSEEWLARPGTVGKASPVLTLSIVGDDGRDLAPGEIGTVYVKRLDGTPDYHDDPEKTESIQLDDGRFTVGDIGWLDDGGFLYLADRRTDLILRGGVNVYPAEIEAAISEHSSVADVAVFGIPDDELGQSIMAVIEPAAGADRTVLADDVLAFARDRLARFKIPQSIDIVDALPREASGKLKKRLLRDPYWVER
ncbi:MAG: AMP-binding protein [Actinomycetia bacterium]|nr:AMP-binding protein [Actinomycetes bacterium]MCP4959261.1 AMP-binding protein [Actinomycetes bacterium]